MRIGLTLYRLVTRNAIVKIKMLTIKVNRLSCGAPKFSLFINSKAAAAISPTIVGRRAAKIFLTIGEFLCIMR